MTLNNGKPMIVQNENTATLAIEEVLEIILLYEFPIDASHRAQRKKVSDAFGPTYREEYATLHRLLYSYFAESANSIRALELIIGKNIIIKDGNSCHYDYHSIYLHQDENLESMFFEQNLPSDEFVRRYRLFCIVDALVGIENTFWALDNLKKFKIFLNENAVNVLISESYAITRSLSAFYAVNMYVMRYKSEKERIDLQNELIKNQQYHSSEMRTIRVQHINETINKIKFAYKISRADINHYKHRAESAEVDLENISKQPARNGGVGGTHKGYIDDLAYVIETFIIANPCVSIEKFKEVFGKQYHDGQPCTIGKRKYYIGRDDGRFYREGLENKHKDDYLEVAPSSLESAYTTAQKNIKERNPTTN